LQNVATFFKNIRKKFDNCVVAARAVDGRRRQEVEEAGVMGCVGRYMCFFWIIVA
jgi:hypothetical protein